MFIISNVSVITGQPATVIYSYKLFNIFSWWFTIDFSRQSKMFRNFQMRTFDGMTLQSAGNYGALLSQPQN